MQGGKLGARGVESSARLAALVGSWEWAGEPEPSCGMAAMNARRRRSGIQWKRPARAIGSGGSHISVVGPWALRDVLAGASHELCSCSGMWLIQDFRVQDAVLDFRSSGQGRRPVTQIVVDGILLANAAELTSWEEPEMFQTIVCAACGFEHCEPGNWLTARRAGEFAAWIPAFGSLREPTLNADRSPPDYIATRGAPTFSRLTHARLRDSCPGLPAFESLPPLTGTEMLHLLQWEAPRAVLGRFPAPPALRRGAVGATTECSVVDARERLASALATLATQPDVSVRPLATGERLVSFFLDGRGSPWSPLVIDTAGDWHLSSGGALAAVLVGSGDQS